MASIGAPLKADDIGGSLGQDGDQFPLPFVAPFGADDHQTGVLRIEHGPLPDKKTGPSRGPVWCILW
jgi:hypothetical protein